MPKLLSTLATTRLAGIVALTVFWLLIDPTIIQADGSGSSPANGQRPWFEATDCPFEIPEGRTIQCGYLVVPEDRSVADSPSIRLGLAILKSNHPTPAPDPLIVLNGGPGSPVVERLPEYLRPRKYLHHLNRDAIILDQRGVGWSQPALECPELAPVTLEKLTGRVFRPDEWQVAYHACRDRWLGQGVNLATYNTLESAADVNDLRQALGYDQVNLFSASYGTLLAQTVMRDYPAGIRSVIIDSGYPLQINLMADTTANLSAGFKQLFADCAADFLCQTFYPDLQTVFYDLLNQLEQGPRSLSTIHPLTGQSFSFTFDAADLVALVKDTPPRQIPGLIYDLHDGNHKRLFEAQQNEIAFLTRYGPRYGAAPGRAMAYSVMCSQHAYNITPAQMTEAMAYPEWVWGQRFITHDLFPLPCEQWLGRPPALAEYRPLVSDIPTLILTGQYDNSQAPAYGKIFAETLRRSFAITVPWATHAILKTGEPCATTIALAFLNDPGHRPETDCLAQAGVPPLDTAFTVRAAALQRPVQFFLGLMGMVMIGSVTSIGMTLVRRRTVRLPLTFTWRNSLQTVGWLPLALSTALLSFGLYASQTGLLPLAGTAVIATILPVIVAIQAAFLLSPEDEPALELLLTSPRPLAWTLLERLATLLLGQGSIGLAFSWLVAQMSGEPLLIVISRWLPLLLCLGGLAIYVTLATRRATLGVLVVCLLWFALTFLGDYMTQRWPFIWPLHLYLSPAEAEYGLNRLFLALLGAGLIELAAIRLLSDEEHLLLGPPGKKSSPSGAQEALINGQIGNGDDLVTPAGLNDRLHLPARPVFLGQLGAMIRYEFLLQWRRAALPALVAGLMVSPVLGAFFSRDQFNGYQAALSAGTLSLAGVKADITAEMLPVIWLGLTMMLMLMLSIIVADTIPKDQHLGVRELLDSLPLPPAVYLTGKLVSLWLSLVTGLGSAALLAGVTWWWLVGPFKLDIYLELWILGATTLALINSSLSMLFAAGQRTNRRAILVGAAFSLLCLLGLPLTFVTLGTGWDFFNPARPILLLYYLVGWPGATLGITELSGQALHLIRQVVSWERTLLTIGGGIAQVGVAWLIVLWQEMKKKN